MFLISIILNCAVAFDRAYLATKWPPPPASPPRRPEPSRPSMTKGKFSFLLFTVALSPPTLVRKLVLGAPSPPPPQKKYLLLLREVDHVLMVMQTRRAPTRAQLRPSMVHADLLPLQHRHGLVCLHIGPFLRGEAGCVVALR